MSGWGEAESKELQTELRVEALQLFEEGPGDHGLSTDDFQLELVLDELGLCVARVRSRASDDKAWDVQEFDDYLMSQT